MNGANKKEKEWKHLIVSVMCIISLVTSITPAHAAVGDLILDTEILFCNPDFYNAENATKSSTLLKEGYSISLDRMWWDETGQKIWITNFSIYKNGDVVKRVSVNENDYFYYNKTINAKECTIIESKVDAIFVGGAGLNLAKLKPFRQYSDGSVILEPDFITASLNPYTNETPPEEWNRTFGGVYDDFGRYGQSVQQTSDGGYILIGSIEIYKPNISPVITHHPFLIKTDKNGNEQWNRTFKDIDLQNAYSVWQTSDEGYIFGGAVPSYRNYPLVRWEKDVRLVKTDSNGSIVWHKTMDVSGSDYVMSAEQTRDGGYILAGLSRSDTDYAWLIKTDVNGSEQWNGTFAVPWHRNIYSVWQTADGGYILASGTNPDRAGSTDAWVIKTDANGKQEWNMTFEPDCFDTVYSIEHTLDGGYLLAGSKGSFETGYNTCLVKIDANGSEQWKKIIGLGLSARISSICQALDGGYVLAGKIDTARNPEFKGQIHYSNYDAWLFKTDADGKLEWSKTFGGLRNDEARFVMQTSDGSYIIAGNTESYGAGGSDLWLVKVADMEFQTSPSEVQTSDNNVTEIPHSMPGRYIPGFEFAVAVFSVLAMLLLKSR